MSLWAIGLMFDPSQATATEPFVLTLSCPLFEQTAEPKAAANFWACVSHPASEVAVSGQVPRSAKLSLAPGIGDKFTTE